MSAVDTFGGSAVTSAWETFWPLTRAKLEITADMIACAKPSGRTVCQRSDSQTVTVTRYRYVPFHVRTIVWIDNASRVGFVPYRSRAVRNALNAHQWQVELETKSWLAILSNARAAWHTYINTGELPPP